MRLKNKNAIITGGSQGFGLEIAKQFLLEGADLMLCARNAETLYQAQQALLKIAKPSQKVLTKTVDVADLGQVEQLAAETLAQLGTIDILVANAGVYGTKGPIEEIDWEEWSRAIDINLKGTVWQCRAVLPHMKRQGRGKIIIISGGGATKPMPNLSAYAASKAGVVRFAETLAGEVADFNIDVNTVAPGALNTRLLEEILEAGPDKVGRQFYEQSLKQQQSGGTPLNVGAALCVFLASEASKGITGRLISAVWDPWKQFPDIKAVLQQSDIYTLRRIVPSDRGQLWDAAK